MFHTKLGMMTAGLVLAALATAGCNQDDKNRIDTLTKENQELSARNKELQAAVAAADERESANARRIEEMQGKELELAALRTENEGLKKRLAEKGAASPTASGWMATTFGDSVTVGTDILFDSGKATLKPEGKHRLDQIVKDIKGTYSSRPIRIYGHTDTDRIQKTKALWTDNLDLSANRAMAVTRYLIDKGINPKLIETIAMGEFHPDSKDKNKNRRVEIFVVKASPGKTAASE